MRYVSHHSFFRARISVERAAARARPQRHGGGDGIDRGRYRRQRAEGRRQRGGRGGCRGFAMMATIRLRERSGRRLHADRMADADHVHSISAKRLRRGHARHVSRCEWQPDARQHRRLAVVGCAGTISGFSIAQSKYGKLSWAEDMKPAVELASKGFPLSYALAESLKTSRSLAKDESRSGSF